MSGWAGRVLIAQIRRISLQDKGIRSGVVAADLVVVESGLVLGELEGYLGTPPGTGDPDEFDPSGAGLVVCTM